MELQLDQCLDASYELYSDFAWHEKRLPWMANAREGYVPHVHLNGEQGVGELSVSACICDCYVAAQQIV